VEAFMTKTRIHYKNPEGSFYYRAAALIIRDDQLLVAKHTDHPCYYTIGGGVEINETSKEAVVREIFEETGLTLEINKLAIIQERFLTLDEEKYHEITFFYTVKENKNINIIENTFTDQGMKETLHWLPLKDIKKIDLAPKFLKEIDLKNIKNIEHIIIKEYS
jgi:8-oxo-dGTP pyrophosphatase MutT (NUDIX family)